MSGPTLESALKAGVVLFLALGLGLMVLAVRDTRALSAARSSPYPPLGRVRAFILVDEHGRTFSSGVLTGKVWVASFIYTRCTSSCPLITDQMARLQKKWSEHADFRLVSITVDPGHDAPDVLLAYARSVGADLKNWSFLTGPPDVVFDLIEKGFLASVYPLTVNERGRRVDIPHTTDIRLVDRQGVMRGRFEGVLEGDWTRLDRAIGVLLAS